MSDFNQCTLPDLQKPSFRQVQNELQLTVVQLRQLGERLLALARRLPQPSRTFESVAELRAAMDCVHNDLIEDAIETLRCAACLSEDQLQARFEERRKWQTVVM
jgi:hypothetical protein